MNEPTAAVGSGCCALCPAQRVTARNIDRAIAALAASGRTISTGAI
jgi:hypothetical protein